jgi:hypothetical protein
MKNVPNAGCITLAKSAIAAEWKALHVPQYVPQTCKKALSALLRAFFVVA